MKISLIIAVYARDDFLRLVLESIRGQVFRDFEVIVAEDGNSKGVGCVVRDFQSRGEIPVTHLTQEDAGFRKARILNRAVTAARGEFLVFIDGDCVLHKHFLREYARRANEGHCLFGRRVMLGQTLTAAMISKGQAYKISFLRVMMSRSRKKEEALYFPFLVSRRKTGMLGCSFCVSRRNIVAINGFDEDFKQPYYGEDTDIERRLKLLGLRMVCTRYSTIQYHLFHATGDRSDAWKISETLFTEKSLGKRTMCANGIVKSE